MEKLYALVPADAPTIKSRIGSPRFFTYVAVLDTLNGMTLLSIIKGICFSFQDLKYVAHPVIEATSPFYLIKNNHEVTHSYERCQNQLAVLEPCGAPLVANTLVFRHSF